jgi:hypothetical protein
MYAPYTYHDDATLSYLEHDMHSVHIFKGHFLLGRACKNATAKANTLRMEHMKQGKVDNETNAETWTRSRKRGEPNACQECISHVIAVFNELDAEVDFLMIQLMPPWVDQIR